MDFWETFSESNVAIYFWSIFLCVSDLVLLHFYESVETRVCESGSKISFWYGRFLEMPQKVCEGDILHVMAYASFLKCPKIEAIQFRCFSRFKIDHVFFSRNAPLFYVRFSWNAPFFPIWYRKSRVSDRNFRSSVFYNISLSNKTQASGKYRFWSSGHQYFKNVTIFL